MAQNQGVYWEKGAMQGCCILFQEGNSCLSIGSEEADGPNLVYGITREAWETH